MFSQFNGRERRNSNQLFNPIHNPIVNYCTETLQKVEMRPDFDDKIFQNIHLIPDPLKKNLADHLITNEKPEKSRQSPPKPVNIPQPPPTKEDQPSTMGGITSFFSGVFNMVTSAMFRSKSPVHYYDCFDADGHQGSPPSWQPAKINHQDKNGTGACYTPANQNKLNEITTDMNPHSRTAVSACENKLNQVKSLLSSKPPSNPIWLRKRPKKVFVEPGSVEESFEDAFSFEDFVSLPNNSVIEYYSPCQYQCDELFQVDAAKIKIEYRQRENKDNKDEIDSACKQSLNLESDKIGNIKLENEKQEKLHLESDKIEKSELEKERIDHLNLESDKLGNKLENEKLENLKLESDKPGNQLKNEITDNLNLESKKLRNNKLENENPNSNLEKEQITDEQQTKQDLNKESTDVVDSVSKLELNLESKIQTPEKVKCEIISSCEDKLAKLKALLQDKKKKASTTEPVTSTQVNQPRPIPITKPADKRFKNPHRTTDKRKKAKIKQNIHDDMVFANEIDIEHVDESPSNSLTQPNLGDYFDEVSGRFETADTDDTFQIVFADTPKRLRLPSECDSEDSFIVFEESPSTCYTSNDILVDIDSDTDSDVSDSGCDTLTCKLSHSLSRTVSNLTDDSLYVESGDEIDCAVVEPLKEVVSGLKTGLLIDDDKKRCRKDLPVKKVHFSTDPPKVHTMRVWAFAARQARAGHWERYAIDRERFKRRIADTDMAVSWVLKPQHRSRVMFQRFMPWWNREKRREAAEREAKRAEEERVRIEEEKNISDRITEEDKLQEGIVEKKEESIKGDVERSGERVINKEVIDQGEKRVREEKKSSDRITEGDKLKEEIVKGIHTQSNSERIIEKEETGKEESNCKIKEGSRENTDIQKSIKKGNKIENIIEERRIINEIKEDSNKEEISNINTEDFIKNSNITKEIKDNILLESNIDRDIQIKEDFSKDKDIGNVSKIQIVSNDHVNVINS